METKKLNGTNNLNVELLNANNYHTWKFRMTILLTEKDVIGWTKEEFNEVNFDVSKVTEKVKARKDNNLCKSLIVQCLDDSQIDLVRAKETAYQMWKSLEERYEKKGISILENMPPDLLTLEVVKTRLRAEIERRKATGAVNDAGNEVKPAAFSCKPGACYGCGEIGHFHKNCPQIKENKLSQYQAARGNQYGRYNKGRNRYGRGSDRGHSSSFNGGRNFN